MQRHTDGSLKFSPSDLTVWLEGAFATWMDRLHAERASLSPELQQHLTTLSPDAEDPELELRARKGTEHEGRYVSRLRAEGRQVVEIARAAADGVAETIAAMRAGAEIIFQGHLDDGTLHGYPDFLVRTAGESRLGAFHYEAWDTKLARSARPYFLVQLCAYAELLEGIQGRRPAEITFVLGDDQERRYRTDDFFFYYRRLKRDFLAFHAQWNPAARPNPALDRGWGRWSDAAEQILAESDHLSRVAGISRRQIELLEAAGIATFTALAAMTAKSVPGIAAATLRRLTRQAYQQQQTTGKQRPTWEFVPPNPKEPRRGLALLPAPSRNDIFFDMEGYPYYEGGLEYLFGAVTVDQNTPTFHDWWAHDTAGEKLAFEEFVDWAYARWEADPSMHIYHYAAYEPNALRRLRDKYKLDANGRDALRALMGKHATRESKVDDMLRGEVFVDLYPTIRQSLIVGTASYSLKDTEKLVALPRSGAVTTAGGSVVEYQRWIDSGEPRAWQSSPILKAIRDYNQVDCESTWLLRDWLVERQREAGITYLAANADEGKGTAKFKREPKAEELLAAAISLQLEATPGTDPERHRVTQLVGHLLGYYGREDRPVWWRYFSLTRDADDEKRFQEPSCLAGLVRTSRPPFPAQRSFGYEFRFNPEQDTTIRLGSKVACTHSEDARAEVIEFDAEQGLVALKIGAKAGAPPDETSIVEFDFVPSKSIIAGIVRFAEGWMRDDPPSQALVDLLYRVPPRVTGHTEGDPLIDESGDVTAQAFDIIAAMDRTTLAIQGPPGSGKTYTAARVIARLLQQGKRIGVTSTGHKVIMNLLCAIEKARKEVPFEAPLFKTGGEQSDIPGGSAIRWLEENEDICDALPDGPVVVGATAWGFCRPELGDKLDYLFVDEAGQVALATLVGMGACATNIVLMGDQMQLAQVTQGVHPPGVEASALTYLLQGHATIPPSLGIFLPITWRMHPRVNRFISDAVYEGRLESHPHTVRQRVAPAAESLPHETGIVVLDVPHLVENSQDSEEERQQIAAIIEVLRPRTVTDRDGNTRAINAADDLLFVTPYNKQVRALRTHLGDWAKVGSVDKFQGQEAPVVIVSMCASSLDDAPRGASFLLNPNRLNVAISRAQTLAIVVASPELLGTRCGSVEEMRLVNLFCRLVEYAGEKNG